MPAGGPGQVAAGGGGRGIRGQAGTGGGDLLGVGGGGAGVEQARPAPSCPAPALTPPVAVGGRHAAAGHTATLGQR